MEERKIVVKAIGTFVAAEAVGSILFSDKNESYHTLKDAGRNIRLGLGAILVAL